MDRQSLSQWTFYSFSMPLTIVHSVDNCGQIVHIMDNCLWYGQLYIPFCRLSMPWTQNTPIYQHLIDLLSWTNFIRKKSSWTLYFFLDPDGAHKVIMAQPSPLGLAKPLGWAGLNLNMSGLVRIPVNRPSLVYGMAIFLHLYGNVV